MTLEDEAPNEASFQVRDFAGEPRYVAEIAERLAADGQLCYAVVERWQLI
jgi:hypothetical protein